MINFKTLVLFVLVKKKRRPSNAPVHPDYLHVSDPLLNFCYNDIDLQYQDHIDLFIEANAKVFS